MSAADVPPAEAAYQAKAWRKAAEEPNLPPGVIKARLDLADWYQEKAVAGGLELGKNADDGTDW